MLKKQAIYLFGILWATAIAAQSGTKTHPIAALATICISQGHPVTPGSSGFNVRIGDKVWSYKHPDFIRAVQEMRPGWLRYWSGTAGDAFCMATGQYDKEYIQLFDKGEEYEKLYRFLEVKGPHRIIDLYQLLGTVGGKLVVTVNGFTETPDMTAELARFCRNNHIEVEAWQLCNEPYFYVPARQRYWWNDGYDYAQKMKPHADSIKKIFPGAKVALNYTWDGVWSFMKEINTYQKQEGAYWNVFSKHSYAPHTGKEERFEEAFKRMNTKLPEVTGTTAMDAIEQWTWKGVPLLITEFGVWNKPLNGILSAIYQAEYTMRQLAHPNTWLIASHEISNKARPAKNMDDEVTRAYANQKSINTLQLSTGMELDDEGKALKILHEATNSALAAWPVVLSGTATVPGLDNQAVDALYALAFKGACGYDYLAVTNRSAQWHELSLQLDGRAMHQRFHCTWMTADSARQKNVLVRQEVTRKQERVLVPPYSVLLVKWSSVTPVDPLPVRIYQAEIVKGGIRAAWWPSPVATGYELLVRDETTGKTIKKSCRGKAASFSFFPDAILGHEYSFSVKAVTKNALSPSSAPIQIAYRVPPVPSIFKTAPRDKEITVFWHSVPGATGYKVIVEKVDGSWKREYDALNVFGFKLKDMEFDTPYLVTVKSYNGLGQSSPSQPVKVLCKKNIPLPPTNISAVETGDGHIALNWNAPKTYIPGTRYRLYRGAQPHVFSLLKDGLETPSYTDTTVQKGKEYFYTVKSYTDDGECSFYPNIATILRRGAEISLAVESVTKTAAGYEVSVRYTNLPAGGNPVFAVWLSDVSYLNGEEIGFAAAGHGEGRFHVTIPFSVLRAGATYSIKARIQINGGTPFNSLPPHKEFKVN